MNIHERILLSLSRMPESGDHPSGREVTVENSLNLLSRVYPDLSRIVAGKRVIDYGCGPGYQSIALVKKHGCTVVGIDSNQRTLERANANARKHDISADRLSFAADVSPAMANSFDVVISLNSFEHYGNPSAVLDAMRSLLVPSGIVLLTFGPPWLSPYGSHMHFFCKVPWLNIFFPEETVMKVRERYRPDGARSYEEVDSGLNRMTITKFEHIMSQCSLATVARNYECVGGIGPLGKLPLLRELFINRVNIVLAKA